MSKFRSIVENILKENAYTDKNNLQLALNTYDTLLRQYYKTMNEYNHEDFDFELLLNGINYFEIETKYGPLEVTFDYNPNNSYNGVFFIGSKSHKPNIIINLAMFSDFEDYISKKTNDSVYIKFEDWTYLLKNHYVKSTFVHEFQHYIDECKGILIKNKEYKPYDNKYYNSSFEISANTMQIIFEISRRILEDNYGEIMEYWTPEQRFDFLKNNWKQDDEFMNYYNKLEPKAQKKLLARLYKYFSADFWDKEKDLRIFNPKNFIA